MSLPDDDPDLSSVIGQVMSAMTLFSGWKGNGYPPSAKIMMDDVKKENPGAAIDMLFGLTCSLIGTIADDRGVTKESILQKVARRMAMLSSGLSPSEERL